MGSPRLAVTALLAASVVALSSGCTGSSSTTCTRDYWVATTGSDDAGDGGEARPFRTIDRARAAVRVDPARGQCTVNVNVAGGTYALAEPLRFGPEDSGAPGAEVVYRSAPGDREPVVISGGIVVEGFECILGICAAEVPSWPRGRIARQLWDDDVRAVRARSDFDPHASIQAANPVYARTAWGYEPVLPGLAPRLEHPEWAEVVTVTQWKMMRCPLLPIPGTALVPDPLCWWNANTYPVPWNFQLLSWIENAEEYLTQPGMWFLNPETRFLRYWTSHGGQPGRVVLPLLETLVDVVGEPGRPATDIRFRGLRFSHATWNGPSADGYVSDQSGNFVKGPGYQPNLTGHQKIVQSTPGNVNVRWAHRITFEDDVFAHLGAMALWFGTGAQDGQVVDSTFTDVSSSAVQVGGVDLDVNVRAGPDDLTSGIRIANNDVSRTGRDYYDTAGIFVMFSAGTIIERNTIAHTPWSGIAIGWGWGLLDEGGFPGMPYAHWFEWGAFGTPTVARDHRITSNHITHFLEQLWDGGAVYVNGSQGTGPGNGLVLRWNVVDHKRPRAGGNVFYTDAGSRYVTFEENVSLANPVGFVDFGSCSTPSTWPEPLCAATALDVSYGAEMGGCVPRGHLTYTGNWFTQPVTFFDICLENLAVPVGIPDVSIRNHAILDEADVPAWLVAQAGRR